MTKHAMKGNTIISDKKMLKYFTQNADYLSGN